jgi:hypothetical protein
MVNRERGLAYLGLLFAVAFLGLVVGTAAEVDATAMQREKERKLLAIGHQFRTAFASYRDLRLAGRQVYPQTLDDLLQDPRFPQVRRHLRRVFVDPMTGKAEWGLVRIGGRIVGVHSLSERMPFKQDGFEADDMSLRGKQRYSEWVFSYPADLRLLSWPVE